MNMAVHTSLLILNLSVFLLLLWYVSLTLKYSVPGYGKNLLFCMHFNRIHCEIKEKIITSVFIYIICSYPVFTFFMNSL